jgi:hypothetical protein
MMLALIVPAVILLVACAFTGGMLIFAVKARNRIKLIEAAPLCKADQLITGLAKMRGTIVALDKEDLLVSPMTKTRCVFYKFVVEEQRTRTVTRREGNRTVTRQETYWHPIITDVQTVPTAVQDKSGEALVDLKEAELTLKAMRANSGTFKSVPADLERTLQKRYGISSKGLIFNKNMRYTEAVIEQGAKVFVVGDCKVKRGGTASFYKGSSPLLVTDKNEEDLVRHYKTRLMGFTIGAIVAPLIIGGIAAFVGYMMHKNQAPPPPKQNAQQQPAPQGPQNPQNPPANVDKITPLLAQLQDPDFKKRAEAARKLADLPVDPERREDVAEALNPLLDETRTDDEKNSAITAVKKWGTQANKAALEKLMNSPKGQKQKNAAKEALDKLPK